MPLFKRYIGIDYAGAKTPTSSLSGLRVYLADRHQQPREIEPIPKDKKKYWTRRKLAEWLSNELSCEIATIVGIDHAFSFPHAYFKRHHLTRHWHLFLEDFQQYWPTHEDKTSVKLVRDGVCGNGAKRKGDATWLRLTEQWTATAKSVFQFDVQGQVATSTHAGLPWLFYLRKECYPRIHFWPFDGWEIPKGSSVVAEVYPSLWMKRVPRGNRNADQQAAYAVAAWLRRADLDGSLQRFFSPPLKTKERTLAEIEGWILGVI